MKSLAACLAILLIIGLVIVLTAVLMGEDVPWRGSDDLEDEADRDEASRPDMEA